MLRDEFHVNVIANAQPRHTKANNQGSAQRTAQLLLLNPDTGIEGALATLSDYAKEHPAAG